MPALCVKGQGGLPKNDHIIGEVKDVGMGLPKPLFTAGEQFYSKSLCEYYLVKFHRDLTRPISPNMVVW